MPLNATPSIILYTESLIFSQIILTIQSNPIIKTSPKNKIVSSKIKYLIYKNCLYLKPSKKYDWSYDKLIFSFKE
jgi:hypothetical protein